MMNTKKPRTIRPVIRAVAMIVFVAALFGITVALRIWRGPQKRSNPDLERKVEEGKRRIEDMKRRDEERARRFTIPTPDVDLENPGDLVDGLSPEARKYLPEEQRSTLEP